MSDRNVIHRAFDAFDRDAGFEKRSGSWYRRGDEVIATSNLQKSQYGPQYYFNQGFCLRDACAEEFPQYEDWHIVVRLDGLLPDAEDEIKELLDLEREIDDEQRTARIRALLDDRLVPLIERGSTVDGLRSMVADGTLSGAGIKRPAYERIVVPEQA